MTSWFLELCTSDRHISYFKISYFVAQISDRRDPFLTVMQFYIISTTPVTDPFLTVTSWLFELCTHERPIFHFKNTIFCCQDPRQPHFSPWQIYIISTTPFTTPFLTVTSWFLELCTRDRPISYFKNIIFCSPDPWQTHFSPWQVYIISTTPVTDPFLTVTSWFSELCKCTRDRPISHFKNTIFCSPDRWQPHLSPWQVYIISTTPLTTPFLTMTCWFWNSLHVTDPFHTSKIPYFVAQIRDNPNFSPWQVYIISTTLFTTHFSPWQVGFWSSVHVTDTFLTSKYLIL